MTHIAIIGTEGSGKTILATVWARQLAHSTESRLFLSYQTIDTERYVERAWENLNSGHWLPSTPQGSRIELEWQLQFGTFKCPIKLIDLPGQDLRNFFSGNYNTLSTDTRELFEYVSSASIVFAVVNLERILKEQQSEDRIVMSEIVRFLSTNAEAQHLYFVFTAWDKVAETVLGDYGSLTDYIKTKLTPFYRTCEKAWNQVGKGIYFLTVAPVAQTEYDVSSDEYLPIQNFGSYNLDNFTKVLIQSLATLQNRTARPAWNTEIIHPYDEELFYEWSNREWVTKRKKRWNKFLKFLGRTKKEEQEIPKKQSHNLNDVAERIGAWNTFTERYARFTGRARRREYWNFSILTTILMLVLFYFCGNYHFIPFAYILVIATPSLAVSVRRMHDIGKSGWWVLVSVIPYIGGIIFLVMACLDGQLRGNEYGPNPKG